MKKFYMILAAIAALTMTAQAQTAGTINVGDFDNASTIYNGSYFDMAPTNFYVAHTGAQLIYTPDMLTDMDGKQNVKITGLKFKFINEGAFEEIVRNVKIYLEETDATEFAVVDGVKQFFTFGEPVYEGQIDYNMLDFYGEDMIMDFDLDFDFTPGKSLLVTIVFDAEDDDNCTLGSDYAPFYTTGIRGKGMTYTANWDSFLDFAEGEDFPDATATLGCGTNVELPVTQIDYTYEEGTTPEDPHMAGLWLVQVKANGEQVYTELFVGTNGDYVNVVNVEYPDYYNICPFYFLIDGVAYGPEEDMTEAYIGNAEHNPLSPNDNCYYVSNGFSYTMGIHFIYDEDTMEFIGYCAYVAKGGSTEVNEVATSKTVASTRYYNMAGQEMQQANGMTIVVTTYTDGTTNVAKVIK